MDDLTPKPSIPSLSFPLQKRRNVAFIIVLVLFCAIGILALFNGRSSKTNSNTNTTGPYNEGDTVVINFGADKFDATGAAILAIDIDSLNAFTAASQNGSAVLDTLMSRGKIFTTPNGTKARVVDSRLSATQVRIIEGDAQGKSGWINNVFLYK